jgi:6-phosphogluconolactonase
MLATVFSRFNLVYSPEERNIIMKHPLNFSRQIKLSLSILLSILSLVLTASAQVAPERLSEQQAELRETARRFGVVGNVYVMTNATTGNEVRVYDRLTDGSLTFSAAYPTGGLGSGGGLGNQGGLILSNNHRWLFAVNAGSNDISVFRVTNRGLNLVDVSSSGGAQPISLTFHRGLLYVLNDASDNITGFVLGNNGRLQPLPGSTRPLSGAGTDPAQISFSLDGDTLMVTEKATNRIVLYSVDRIGYPGQPVVRQSAGATPFGFAFGKDHQVFVSEAFGGAANASALSSYVVDEEDHSLNVISRSVGTTQTAACWVVLTPDGRLAFVTNTGSDSISSYRIAFNGALSLVNARAAATGGGPIDVTLSADGRFLYVLNRAGGSIGDYTVRNDGQLVSIPGGITGLPASANGIAAR